MRVLICGSRDAPDDADMQHRLNLLLHELEITYGSIREVISGCADGGDRLGERWAQSESIPIQRFPAPWKEHGRAAGPIRNRQMLREGLPTHVVAIWNGSEKSKGTLDMIRVATQNGVPVSILPIARL